MTGGVAIILVNWNGWADTIECLESVFRSRDCTYRVVVVDNASTDDSCDRIVAWAEGRLEAAPRSAALRSLSFPPVPKPLPYVVHAGDGPVTPRRRDGSPSLALIRNTTNGGFAAGVNTGLRHVLAAPETRYAWLLNNDTVVAPDALAQLVGRMEEAPGAGMCGSTVRYYAAPSTVQALGGARYNKWLGATWHLRPAAGGGFAARAPVERRLSYVLGASMLVSRRFLEDVGAMSEEYFLFFEELDWAIRARGRYTLAFAPDSVVYHKEGASIGTSGDPRRRSAMAECFLVANRLRLTRKFYPLALPTVYVGVALGILRRIAEGQWRKAWLLLRVALGCAGDHQRIRRLTTAQ